MKIITRLTLVICLGLSMSAFADGAATRPTRVLIVSIDGLRPDVALRARTPRLHQLMEEGSFSFWARTTPVAITLPSHASMLTGVTVDKHGIEWNRELPFSEPVYPAFPTIFEVARQRGYSTGMAAGKSKFSALAKPATIDWAWITAKAVTDDADVADHAVQLIQEHRPQVMFVHFPSVDSVGHARGWGSAEQLAAAEKADESLGRVLAALEEAKVKDQTLVIVTADHGGAGRSHGADDERSRHIPWIATGPGVRKNYDLTLYPGLVINTYDTFATACYVLDIPLGKAIDGKPIEQIFSGGEMLKESGK